MGLELYHQKRDFKQTPEPRGKVAKRNLHRFVVQEHHASMLHFDFRLEMGGVLKSWSVRRGPSLDPTERRLAVETEDHPVEYLKFEGHIPEGNYGAGQHMIWDAGTYELAEDGADPLKQLEAGKLKFQLHGEKLEGTFNLIKLGGKENQWLLIKSRDEFAQAGWKLKLRAGGDENGADQSRRSSRAKEQTARKPVKKYDTRASAKDAPAVSAATLFKRDELSGDVRLKIGTETVELTHLEKIYWPEAGYTKGDLIRYYHEVSRYILPYLKERPLIMKRYPDGISGKFFHQHDVDRAPEYVRTAELEAEGHAVDYIVGDNQATLLYMANMGAIERHPWHSRVRQLDRPDWFVFDLDPGKGVEFQTICELASGVRSVLTRLGLEGYPKTSGSRGIHVYVPIKPDYTYEQIALFAEQVATAVAREHPQIATVERSLSKRKSGQIYVDHMQNARGKSVVAPYSVRPREGATVSAPLTWSEVQSARISTQDFHIKNMMRRIKSHGELFKPVLNRRQSLMDAMERIKA